MTIALSTKMNELLLAAFTAFDHLLLSRPVRRDNAVAFHRALISHYFVLHPKLLA